MRDSEKQNRPFLISFNQDENRKDCGLEKRLQSLNARRVLAAQWVISSPLSGELLYNDLIDFVSYPDRLLIVEIVPSETGWDNLLIGNEEFRALVFR